MIFAIFVFLDQITKKYIGFFIPEEGDALAMAHAFYDFLKKNGLEKVLLALSLDGENKNTGVLKVKEIFILSILVKQSFSTQSLFEIFFCNSNYYLLLQFIVFDSFTN